MSHILSQNICDNTAYDVTFGLQKKIPYSISKMSAWQIWTWTEGWSGGSTQIHIYFVWSWSTCYIYTCDTWIFRPSSCVLYLVDGELWEWEMQCSQVRWRKWNKVPALGSNCGGDYIPQICRIFEVWTTHNPAASSWRNWQHLCGSLPNPASTCDSPYVSSVLVPSPTEPGQLE